MISPPDRIKVNVGTDERPVYRIRRRTRDGEHDERPTGILFRLNTELSQELTQTKGSIDFTLMARRVFGVLRRFARQPTRIRLFLFILRQTNAEFQRPLSKALEGLGWDADHPARAIDQLKEALEQLRDLNVLETYQVDQHGDRLTIAKNPNWHKEEATVNSSQEEHFWHMSSRFLAHEFP